MEDWRVLTDYPNYSVSSFGNVRNDKTGQILKGSIDSNGYLRVSLYKEKKQYTKKIHTLVGGVFLENPENKYSIDHVNQNKIDNNVSNLRYATKIEQGRNRKKWDNCSSKYKGVCLHKSSGKWSASIKLNKSIHLGLFKTEEEAKDTYNNFIKEKGLEEFYNLS